MDLINVMYTSPLGDTVPMCILDCPGATRFKTINNAYYKKTFGFIIVFDITDKVTFKNLKEWIDGIHK